MKKEIKGYSAIFDNLDGSFDYICSAKTEKECEEKAYKEGYDNATFSCHLLYICPLCSIGMIGKYKQIKPSGITSHPG